MNQAYALMDQVGFTADDLIANRDGNLSEYQRKRLRFILLRDTLLYGLFALLPLLVLLFLLSGQGSSPLVIVVLALLTLAFSAYVVSLQRSTRADLASGGVKAVSGRIDLHDVGRGIYRLEIGPKSFQISAKVYAAFMNGKFYRIYYAPNLKMILSAELAEV